MPCRPVSVYPSSQPWQLCSDSTSITRPSREMDTSSASTRSANARSEISKTAPSRLLFVSSGQNSRNRSGLRAYTSRSIRPRARVDSARPAAGWAMSTA
jgi:hypothetical protein